MDDTLRIDADRDHLFRIVSNLVRNAIEAVEGVARVAARGRFASGPGATGAAFSSRWRDTGPGVPQKARDHLFEAFTGSQRKGGKVPYGLAIAAEIIGVHGGHVRLLDTAKGAAFQFEIPDRGVHQSHDGARCGGQFQNARTARSCVASVRLLRRPCGAISSGELRRGG